MRHLSLGAKVKRASRLLPLPYHFVRALVSRIWPCTSSLPLAVLSLGSGFVCGFLMWLVGKIKPITRANFFNDRGEWHLPTDYEYVVVKDDDENTVELEDMNGVKGSHIRALRNNQIGTLHNTWIALFLFAHTPCNCPSRQSRDT